MHETNSTQCLAYVRQKILTETTLWGCPLLRVRDCVMYQFSSVVRCLEETLQLVQSLNWLR